MGRDQRHVRARSAPGTGGVNERRLEERAALAVESTTTGLEVGDRSAEGAVACVCAAGREDIAALDQSRLQAYS